jgi:hypothetical protein
MRNAQSPSTNSSSDEIVEGTEMTTLPGRDPLLVRQSSPATDADPDSITPSLRSAAKGSSSSGDSVYSHATAQSGQSSQYSRRSAKAAWVNEINKHSIMAKHLFRSCVKNQWISQKCIDGASVTLRSFKGGYILYPPEDRNGDFERAVTGLNVEVILIYMAH